ncbi:hypothetical protein MTYM_00649 [Methylococcales bacterium]|nr:hypothetical protein MTYM_00649 [Methylococcales bacterium]
MYFYVFFVYFYVVYSHFTYIILGICDFPYTQNEYMCFPYIPKMSICIFPIYSFWVYGDCLYTLYGYMHFHIYPLLGICVVTYTQK